ncbi:MAG TPA: CoA-binding protein [Actinomycetota bacterium]|nr:CoA-binding protein [Actinomycetota bacterium]
MSEHDDDEDEDGPVYSPSDDELRRIYADTRTIAVVGASGNPSKAAYSIPRYLQSQGYRIIPVNPSGGTIHGEPARAALSEIDEPIDVVDVFRPAAETPGVARAAVAAGAKVLWLQEGIYNDEARAIGEDAGLTVIMGKCMGATHWTLIGEGSRGGV